MRKYNLRLNIILVSIIILGVVIGFALINHQVTPIMLEVAKEETNKLSTLIINDAIKKQVVDGLSFDKLFIITYENGEVATIDFDSVMVNKVLSTITATVQTNLKYLEDGEVDMLELSDNVLVHYNQANLKKGIIYEIPLSIVYNNPFLTNLSPKVPVRINLIGSLDSGIRTKVTNYGINNALIEVYVDTTVNLQVILPFQSEVTKVKMSAPLALKMIRGKVPEYYSNGSMGPTISLPNN